MNKQIRLEGDLLIALAAWHGVSADELGLHWQRLANAFARVVEFTGLTTAARHADSVGVADQVAGRAFHLLMALSQLVQTAGELAE